jgi:hypothetical protein
MVRTQRAFTLFEAAVVACVLVVFAAFAMTFLKSREYTRTPRDAAAVRGLMQGFGMWAGSNQDRFPLPSLLDAADATVPEKGAAKDTTANIFSLLIFNSYIPPEILISTEEANPNIRVMEGYAHERPPGAVDPANALWDPALRADFTGSAPGNVSFGHMVPEAPQEGSFTLSATRAVVGNRGPRITGVAVDERGLVVPAYAPTPSGTSRTFLIHGRRDRWEGFIGYGDNHVNFETHVAPEGATYRAADGRARPDCLFFEEVEGGGMDNFLGIFTKAGAERKDFVAIWD